jgi:hypothetical protein
LPPAEQYSQRRDEKANTDFQIFETFANWLTLSRVIERALKGV